MTAEERERNERWLRKMAEDEPDCTGGAVPYFAWLYPIPDTSGMTPEEAETILAKWRAEVNAAMEKGERPQSTPSGTPLPSQPPSKPEAPVA